MKWQQRRSFTLIRDTLYHLPSTTPKDTTTYPNLQPNYPVEIPPFKLVTTVGDQDRSIDDGLKYPTFKIPCSNVSELLTTKYGSHKQVYRMFVL